MPATLDRCLEVLQEHPEVENVWALCQWMHDHGEDVPSIETAEAALRARGSMQDHDNAAFDGNKRPHTSRSARRGADGALEVRWLAQTTAELAPTPPALLSRAYPGARTIRLKGTFIDTTVNLNGWRVPPEELAGIARQLSAGLPMFLERGARERFKKDMGFEPVPVQVRIDHGESVRDVIGQYERGILLDAQGEDIPIGFDTPAARLNEAVRVDFEALVHVADPNVAVPILTGGVRGVSPQLRARRVECDECGAAAWPMRECDHVMAADVMRQTRVHEGSIVASPAYEDRTTFMLVGFAAGLASVKKSEVRTTADPPNPANPAAPPATAGWDAAMKAMNENADLKIKLAKYERDEADRMAKAMADQEAKKAAAEKEKAEADKKAAAEEARRKVAEAERGVTDEQARAARSAGRAPTDAERAAKAGVPKRAFGAMAGSIDQQVQDTNFFDALKEIRAAVNGDPAYPVGKYIKTPPGGEQA